MGSKPRKWKSVWPAEKRPNLSIFLSDVMGDIDGK